MRRWVKHLVSSMTVSCLTIAGTLPGAIAADGYDPYSFLRQAAVSSPQDVEFKLVSQITQPQTSAETAQPLDIDVGRYPGVSVPQFSEFEENQQATQNEPAPVAEGTNRSEEAIRQNQDVGQVLTQAPSIQTVGTQRRSPVAFEPYVRGYRSGQVYSIADGQYWMAVRPDLDSMLNKIDPSSIEQATIIPGPYGLRYGPGFSFIDIATADTPRYQNGFEAHHKEGFTVRTNGGQMYGRETVYGGSSDYGFILNYSGRTGSDYEAGDGTPIPSSYKTHSLLGQFGVDLTEDSSLEFRYSRLDGSGTEVAAQIFDIDFMVSDSYLLSYVAEDPTVDARTRGDMWYNRTRLLGTVALNTDPFATGKRLPAFAVLDRIEEALADELAVDGTRIENATNTDGDATSTGARLLKTYGADDWVQFTVGSDVRYIEQQISETFFISSIADDNNPDARVPIPGFDPLVTNMPRANMIDPGVFAEWKLPMLAYWDFRLGGRVDWVHTEAGDPRPNGQLDFEGHTMTQEDILYAFYATNDVDVTENLTTRIGFGHAQRPPTLIERYADGLFLGLIQSGFSRVVGQPELQEERNWQFDWSVEADYEYVRGRASFFHAWVSDYITYEANLIATLPGARFLRPFNTDLATLTGGEGYVEWDALSWLTAFGSGRYIDGRDRDIDQPLAMINPFEMRNGIRIHNPANERWGFESGMRIVDEQDRLAALRRIGAPGVVDQVEIRTPGFTTYYIRGFYNVTRDLNLVAGIDNLTDKRYLEHLDLRIPAQLNDDPNDLDQDPNDPNFRATEVLSPGITPYFGIEWNH